MQIEEKEYIVSDLEGMNIVTDLLSQEKVKYLAVENFICWFKPFSTPTIFLCWIFAVHSRTLGSTAPINPFN